MSCRCYSFFFVYATYENISFCLPVLINLRRNGVAKCTFVSNSLLSRISDLNVEHNLNINNCFLKVVSRDCRENFWYIIMDRNEEEWSVECSDEEKYEADSKVIYLHVF